MHLAPRHSRGIRTIQARRLAIAQQLNALRHLLRAIGWILICGLEQEPLASGLLPTSSSVLNNFQAINGSGMLFLRRRVSRFSSPSPHRLPARGGLFWLWFFIFPGASSPQVDRAPALQFKHYFLGGCMHTLFIWVRNGESAPLIPIQQIVCLVNIFLSDRAPDL